MMPADTTTMAARAAQKPKGSWTRGMRLKFMPKMPPSTIRGSATVATMDSCFITRFIRFEVCDRYVSSTPASRSRVVSTDSMIRMVWSYTSR